MDHVPVDGDCTESADTSARKNKDPLKEINDEIADLKRQLNAKIKIRNQLEKERKATKQESPPSTAQQETDFCVTSLSTNTSIKTLREYFLRFGRVNEVKMTVAGKNNGSADVSFTSISDYDSLTKYEHVIDGSLVQVQPKQEPECCQKSYVKFDEKTRSVMISGYLLGLEKADYKEYFQQFGKISHFSDTSKNRLRRDSYKYVFMKFEDYATVDRIMEFKPPHLIKGVEIVVKKAKDL